MTGWFEPFVHHSGPFGLGADILLEAMGAPLHGETLLVVAARLAADGTFAIVTVAVVAFVAAVAGDNLAYLIGRWFGRPVILARGGRIGLTHVRLARVEQGLDHCGWVVITAVRFFPPLRQFNGLAAGAVGLHWLHFLFANAAEALWLHRRRRA